MTTFPFQKELGTADEALLVADFPTHSGAIITDARDGRARRRRRPWNEERKKKATITTSVKSPGNTNTYELVLYASAASADQTSPRRRHPLCQAMPHDEEAW